ncbi:MAG: S8 family serine peptidase [Chthonomonadales bacterium]|nr:S8 family serine peptidase [Chthonomonadales bacterium]
MQRRLAVTATLMLLVSASGARAQFVLNELRNVLPGPPRQAVPRDVDHLIRLATETIDVRMVTPQEAARRTEDGLKREGLTDRDPAYYLVHTMLPAGEQVLAAIRRAGAEPVSLVPRNTYIVRATGPAARAVAALAGVDLVTLYQPMHRVSPRLLNKLAAAPDTVTVRILLFRGENDGAAVAAFQSQGGLLLGSAPSRYGAVLRMRFPSNVVPLLANRAGVQWIEEYLPPRITNDASTGFGSVTGVPAGGILNVEPVWNIGLTGTGMVVGHADTGLDNGVNDASMLDDFEGRIFAAFSWRSTTLASHVSGGFEYVVPNGAYEAQRFVASATGTVNSLALGLYTNDGYGSCSGAIFVSLHADTGSGPGALLANGQGTRIGVHTLEPAAHFYYSAFRGAQVTSGASYWIVLDMTGVTGNVGAIDTQDGSNRHRHSADGTTWGAADAANLVYEVYAAGGWSDLNGHGTHTAGSILGSGANSAGQYRGSAFDSMICHQSLSSAASGALDGFPDDSYALYAQAYDSDARIHSDSWGSDTAGTYDIGAMQADEFMWDFPDMLLLFSAGNAGEDANSDGIIDLGSVGSPATAKGCITVGASESVRTGVGIPGRWGDYVWGGGVQYTADPIETDPVSNNYDGMAALSSRGPCGDGRVKPDLVAPGTNVISARSQVGSSTGWGVLNAFYMYDGGTSMSCPLAAGAAALARQYYVERRGFSPSAALLKATMIHGAADMPGQYAPSEAGPVPNNNEGWGRVDLAASLIPQATTYYLDATAANSKLLTNATPSRAALVRLADTSQPLRATLAWTDPPSNPVANGGLINDIDLRIVRRTADDTADEQVYLPKLPNGAGTGADSTNTVEQVEIATGDLIAGRIYRIEVSANGALAADFPAQPFGLLVSGPLSEPTAARIAGWSAERRDGRAVVRWSLAEGSDVAGARVLRASDWRGPFRPVGPGLVPASEGTTSYRLVDPDPPSGKVYYRLETVTKTGRTERWAPILCPDGKKPPAPARRAPAQPRTGRGRS